MMNCTERSLRLEEAARARLTRGSVTVEMAIVAPVLILLLFGIIEVGLIFKDAVSLNSACREGVRAAALGSGTTEVTNRVQAAATGLTGTSVTVDTYYRTYSSGTWSSWTLLAAGGATPNAAPTGAQMRVTLGYPHRLIAGGFFPGMMTDPQNRTLTIHANLVMRRE